MIRTPIFSIVLLGVALAAYLFAGGFGLLVTGLFGCVFLGNPFGSPRHGASSALFMSKSVKMIQDRQPYRPGSGAPRRFAIRLALCFGLIVIGVLRMETKGFLGSIG